MGCPFYIDFTRECIKKFPNLTNIATFDICESEHYTDCQIYLMCISKFTCEYQASCVEQYIENLPKFSSFFSMDEAGVKDMTNILMKYCLSAENFKTCAKYQMYSIGKKPPITFLPDGRKINPIDILFKRKIIIQPPK